MADTPKLHARMLKKRKRDELNGKKQQNQEAVVQIQAEYCPFDDTDDENEEEG